MPDYGKTYQLRLPDGGPVARGRLLEELGKNGSPKFLVLAGSPVRLTPVPSFAKDSPSSDRLRNERIADGSIGESASMPGCLETRQDIVCNSPSAAAEMVLGRSGISGWAEWKDPDGNPLRDDIAQAGWGRRRTWLVRGSNVSGVDLVEELWRREDEGIVSLAATRLRQGVPQGVSKNDLRGLVEEDYEGTTTYNQRRLLVDDLHAFLSRMKPGDGACTVSDGRLYVGEIDGDIEQIESKDGRSNLRRPTKWKSGEGFAVNELPEALQQKLSVPEDVVDLTSVQSLVQAVVQGLGRSDRDLADDVAAGASAADASKVLTRREVELPEPSTELAADLLVHDIAWLHDLRALLADERQLVLYGPPGTGKTHLALRLAEFFGGGPERVTLVQFHPSYSYEDFFEGFRPRADPDSGDVAFRLTPGPLRKLADLAGAEGNESIPHFLVIDELNRANLAKVFGELYFLLEYRNKSIRLTYSEELFQLPKNVFVIGTMNTADRSIALVDAAMRRRFAFVELSPRAEPTRGLLRRWLSANERDPEPADLLDALNVRIADPHVQIGPAYLMKEGAHREDGLARTWRTKILPLLEEYHYGGAFDVEATYGLAALRAAIGSRPT